jgi:hypothetical protein
LQEKSKNTILTNTTGNGGKIPKRWLYPVSAANNNTENYKSALQRQFGAEVDDLNMEIWINKD